VFLHLVARMTDRFLEQRNYIKCLTLGKNEINNCAMLSEAYGGELKKKSSAFQ
jgi:hypothetical protein